MPIEFHCPHCGKQIRTGSEHAGRHGKCPSCQQKVYIPTPRDEIELLELAPMDTKEEAERQRLIKETQELTRKILTDKEKLADSGGSQQAAAQRKPGGGSSPASSPSPAPAQHSAAAASASRDVAMPKTDIETLVYEYAICMADGELAEAAELAEEIKKDSVEAGKIIQRLIMDEIPPVQLAKIPRPVLMGFLKQLKDGK